MDGFWEEYERSADLIAVMGIRQHEDLLSTRLSELVASGLDVHRVVAFSNDTETTALHVASSFANEAAVRTLLTVYGAEADILRHCGNLQSSAISMAAQGGNLQVLEALMARVPPATSVDVCSNDGITPLMSAIKSGRLEVASNFISRGADIRARTDQGRGLVHFAALSGSEEALEFVVELLGPEVLTDVDDHGATCLHLSAGAGWAAGLLWILQNGGAECLTMLTREGDLPLHWAASAKDVPADINCYGVALLMTQGGHTLWTSNGKGKNVAELMLEHGQERVRELLALLGKSGQLRWTPAMLLWTVQYGNPEVCDLMASWMRDVEYSREGRILPLLRRRATFGNKCLLELAATVGNVDALDTLLLVVFKHLAPQEVRQQLQWALHLSLVHNNAAFASALANKGVQDSKKLSHWIRGSREHFTSTVDAELRSQLQAASKLKEDQVIDELPLAFLLFHSGRHDIASFITEHRAWDGIINEAGPITGRTSMHWATILKRKDIVSHLQRIFECHVNQQDAEGKVAYQYAAEMKLVDIQKLLETERPDVKNYLDLLYRDRQLFVDALNAILVGSALISSISFAGFLQPPLGFTYEERADTRQLGIRLFWIFNGLSFFLGMASTLAGAKGVLPMTDVYIGQAVGHIQRALRTAAALLVMSICFILLAFGAAGFSGLPPSTGNRLLMIGTSSIGGALCVPIMAWFVRSLLPPRV